MDSERREDLPLRVVKLGGSLLTWPPVVVALRAWFSAQLPARSIVLTGGGVLVDGLREIDRAQSLCPEVTHRLAIELMDVSARLLHAQLPEAVLSETLNELWAAPADRPIIFAAGAFLAEAEPNYGGEKLAADWTVTSDSIAARLAGILDADELVLLKSRATPQSTDESGPDWRRYAATGYVDEQFPRYAAACREVRLVNLREWA